MIIGFDFGTTNSLISVVVGERVVDIFDEEGLPYPSIVRYEGERTIVGREAKRALEEAGIGIHGNTVRSPKFLLGKGKINVGGVERSPIDVAAAVIRFVKSESLKSPQRTILGDLDRAVVTIPITMNGERRRELREAFGQAGISIVQFVHEPLAAIYGYLRGADVLSNEKRALKNRNALVVDWGGGTLDLTLCKVEKDRVLQIRNGGNQDIGGDEFDHVIRDTIVNRFSLKNGINADDIPSKDAKLKLLQDTERNKIELSVRDMVTFYRPGYFPRSGKTLEYPLTRTELEEITEPLISKGIRHVQALLESAGLVPAQVSLVLVVGGMAVMPAIQSRLHEIFGTERVIVPNNSATLVSQGAAWIAHDSQRLLLAKQIELELARSSRLPIVKAGSKMPVNNQINRDIFHLYCTDPSDGFAKFPITAPCDITDHPQASDPRTSLGMLSIRVNEKAPKLFERLALEVAIDADLVLSVKASSSDAHDSARGEYYDLEFGLGLPGENKDYSLDSSERNFFTPDGGLVVRANTGYFAGDSNQTDQSLVPGDVLYKFKPSAFHSTGSADATETQKKERLFYQPCARCGLSYGHPDCHCK